MQRLKEEHYFHKLFNARKYFPYCGQIDLTYRCSLNCLHCYCKGLGPKGRYSKSKELTTSQVKKVLDEICREGCIFITLSGGDPLIRKDFFEIYSYAKRKGFIINLFTAGQNFSDKVINFFIKSPPYTIEITLNGVTEDTYEAVTQVKGSFRKVMSAVKLLAKNKASLELKSNCLKQNKHEVTKVKEFSVDLLGKPSEKSFHFKYDPNITPKLNGDTSVCDFRLSAGELLELKRQDKDFWAEHQRYLRCGFPDDLRDKEYLYKCNIWMQRFYIDPYGRLKFCMLTDKFSVDLKTTSFREGFYNVFPQLLREKFKTNSKCRDCRLRLICHYCPAKAFLETGNEEGPVPYFCSLAQATLDEMSRVSKRRSKKNKSFPTLAKT